METDWKIFSLSVLFARKEASGLNFFVVFKDEFSQFDSRPVGCSCVTTEGRRGLQLQVSTWTDLTPILTLSLHYHVWFKVEVTHRTAALTHQLETRQTDEARLNVSVFTWTHLLIKLLPEWQVTCSATFWEDKDHILSSEILDECFPPSAWRRHTSTSPNLLINITNNKQNSNNMFIILIKPEHITSVVEKLWHSAEDWDWQHQIKVNKYLNV